MLVKPMVDQSTIKNKQFGVWKREIRVVPPTNEPGQWMAVRLTISAT